MFNKREVARRLMKYILLVLIVAFACFKLIKTKLSNNEILLISLLAGSIYCLLDIVSPSINLKIDKNCGI